MASGMGIFIIGIILVFWKKKRGLFPLLYKFSQDLYNDYKLGKYHKAFCCMFIIIKNQAVR